MTFKFKIWDNTKEQCWFKGFCLHSSGAYRDNTVEQDKDLVKNPYWKDLPDGFILLQWTGLYDINNKEIWEGDILEFFRKEQDGQKPIRKVVEWKKQGYLPQNMTDGGEIVGNIYENPELLK